MVGGMTTLFAAWKSRKPNLFFTIAPHFGSYADAPQGAAVVGLPGSAQPTFQCNREGAPFHACRCHHFGLAGWPESLDP
jgi:hypothetical protein